MCRRHLNNLEFYLGQILSLYEGKSLGKYLTQIFSFIAGQYLAQVKIQIVKQIGCVDTAFDSMLTNLIYIVWSTTSKSKIFGRDEGKMHFFQNARMNNQSSKGKSFSRTFDRSCLKRKGRETFNLCLSVCFILLIHEGSHPGRFTRNSNSVMTSSAGPVPRVA